jgi:hypothetical protein
MLSRTETTGVPVLEMEGASDCFAKNPVAFITMMPCAEFLCGSPGRAEAYGLCRRGALTEIELDKNTIVERGLYLVKDGRERVVCYPQILVRCGETCGCQRIGCGRVVGCISFFP